MAEKPPISVRFDEGVEIALDPTSWRWSAAPGADEASAAMASAANCLGYEYSPADGEPGFAFATLAAERLGGRAALPPVPARGKGEVF